MDEKLLKLVKELKDIGKILYNSFSGVVIFGDSLCKLRMIDKIVQGIEKKGGDQKPFAEAAEYFITHYNEVDSKVLCDEVKKRCDLS